MIKGTLDGVLGPVHGGWGRHPEFPKPAPGWGHHPMPPKPAPGWGHHPDWGERPPGWGHHPTLPKPAPGWGHHPRVKTMEWNYERDGDPGAGLGPIGTYDPRFPPQVVPLGKGW